MTGGSKLSASVPRDKSAQSGRKTGYTLAGFVEFAKRLGIKVEAFQKRMLKPHFDGTRELVILVPKKNGKTTLLAALALFHIQQVPEAECVIGASSRDQAGILFRQAQRLVQKAELEEFRVLPGYREVRHGLSRLRVLAADAATADGVIPTLALVDELHRHPSGDLYGVFRDGLGPRNGRMITISTAGAKMASPLGELRSKAHVLPNFRRVACRNEASSSDSAFVWIEWCLLDTDDVSDIALVEKANPASWVTKAWLTERHNSPTTTPGQWMRFACGIWTEGDEPFIAPVSWDVLAGGGIEAGEQVTLAVRAAAGVGIGIAAAQDGIVTVLAELVPAPPGSRVPLEVVERHLQELCQRYAVREILYDPEQFLRSAELLTQGGLPMVEAPQRPMRLAQATATFWRLVSAGLLRHNGSPELRAQVMLGRTKETVQGWYVVPTAETAGLIAVVMAAHQASLLTEEKVYVAF